MRTAWNIDGDLYVSLATHHLHSIFEPPSSKEEDEGEEEDFASRGHSSNIKHVVKEAISQVQVYLEIRLAYCHGRDQSDENSSSSGDGGVGYNLSYSLW